MKSLQCPGCFPIYQPNQLAHCEMGGCLWCPISQEEDDLFLQIEKDLEKIMNNNDDERNYENECCICFENINKNKNNCVTECGHIFCLKCLVNSMYYDTWSCPYCRTKLIDIDVVKNDGYVEDDNYIDDDDDDDSEYISDYENENHNENENVLPYEPPTQLEDGEIVEENVNYCTNIEELTRRIESAGFTTKDLVYMLLERHSEQYSEEHTVEMLNTFDKLIQDVDNEYYENQLFRNEDQDVREIESIS
jgi:hypothetical protein